MHDNEYTPSPPSPRQLPTRLLICYFEVYGILDYCTDGIACTREYVLLMLPVLEVFGPSVLLILPSTPST